MDKTRSLEFSLKRRLRGKIAVLGVGNEDRGDDGVGPVVAKQLVSTKKLKSFNCEEIPESYTGAVIEFKPETILVVDAVDFGGRPGEVTLLETHQLAEATFDTHRAPLKVLLNYLRAETKAEAYVIGIQPQSTRYGEGLSPEVAQTAEKMVAILAKIS